MTSLSSMNIFSKLHGMFRGYLIFFYRDKQEIKAVLLGENLRKNLFTFPRDNFARDKIKNMFLFANWKRGGHLNNFEKGKIEFFNTWRSKSSGCIVCENKLMTSTKLPRYLISLEPKCIKLVIVQISLLLEPLQVIMF